MYVTGKYFYGNEISEYGQKNGFVDYRTLAKAFDAVIANDFMTTTADIGYWEPVNSEEYYEDSNGNIYTVDEAQARIDELNERIDELNDKLSPDCTEEENTAFMEEADEIKLEIERLEDPHYYDVFQWFIVSDSGAEILKEADEVLYYNDALGLYLWGVTHYGTAWDYVLTNIRCNAGREDC